MLVWPDQLLAVSMSSHQVLAVFVPAVA